MKRLYSFSLYAGHEMNWFPRFGIQIKLAVRHQPVHHAATWWIMSSDIFQWHISGDITVMFCEYIGWYCLVIVAQTDANCPHNGHSNTFHIIPLSIFCFSLVETKRFQLQEDTIDSLTLPYNNEVLFLGSLLEYVTFDIRKPSTGSIWRPYGRTVYLHSGWTQSDSCNGLKHFCFLSSVILPLGWNLVRQLLHSHSIAVYILILDHGELHTECEA
jgi:hypothetical protein